MSDEQFWKVGDTISGAGRFKPGTPYIIPTCNEQGQLCDMEITNLVMTGPAHFTGTVAAITPYPQTKKSLRTIRPA